MLLGNEISPFLGQLLKNKRCLNMGDSRLGKSIYIEFCLVELLCLVIV